MMRNVLYWMTCVGLTASAIAGSPGYLTRVGPVPLRFLAPPSAAAKAALPPLDLGNPPAAEDLAATNRAGATSLAGNHSGETNSPAALSSPFAAPLDSQSPTNLPGAGPLLLAPPDAASPAAPTADKFVRFFMPVPVGTNGTGYVEAPVRFSPPTPANAAPVSRATYRTPPN